MNSISSKKYQRMSLEEYRAIMTKKTRSKRGTPYDRLKRITAGNGYARATSRYESGVLTLEFDMANLASLNIVLACNRFTQSAYAKAWHALVAKAVASLPNKPEFERVSIYIERVSNRQLDGDNVFGKALVDGLRHAGVIKDDTTNEVVSITTGQKLGDKAVKMVVSPA